MHGESSSWVFQLPLRKNLLHSSTATSLRGHSWFFFNTYWSKLSQIQCGPCRLGHKTYFCLVVRPPLVPSQFPCVDLEVSCFVPYIHNQQLTWMHRLNILEEKFHLLRSSGLLPLRWWYTSSWMLNSLVACSWVALLYPHHPCWTFW